MAENVFLGGATAVAQVDNLTPGGTIEVGDKFIVTLTAEDGTTQSLTYAATGTTVASVCAGLVAAFNASTQSLFTAITASDQTTHVRLTADSAGVPFYCTASTTESDDSPADAQTFVRAASTACAGPKDWNTTANWLTGAVPVTTDSVTLDGRMANEIIYGLNQSSVTLAKLTTKDSLRYNLASLTYALKIGVTSLVIGEPAGDGSTGSGPSIININGGTVQSTVRAIKANGTGSSGYPAFQFAGTHASNDITVEAGSVGIGTATPGQATTILTGKSVGRSAKVEIGTNVTLGTWTMEDDGGKLLIRSAFTTLETGAGTTCTTEGSGAGTTANVRGTFHPNSSGTLTTLNVEGNGFADYRQSSVERITTNVNLIGPGARLDASSIAPASIAAAFPNGADCKNGANTTQANWGTGTNTAPTAA